MNINLLRMLHSIKKQLPYILRVYRVSVKSGQIGNLIHYIFHLPRLSIVSSKEVIFGFFWGMLKQRCTQ